MAYGRGLLLLLLLLQEPRCEVLEELAPAAGILLKVIVVAPPELDAQLEWPPPALADEAASAVGGNKLMAADAPDSDDVTPFPVAVAPTPKLKELKVLVEAPELVEQPPKLPLTPV
jgi:hypothetical protein